MEKKQFAEKASHFFNDSQCEIEDKDAYGFNKNLMEISSRPSRVLELLGQEPDESIEKLFSNVRTKNSEYGALLLKLKGQLVRLARSIEMRMLDTEKCGGTRTTATYKCNPESMAELVSILSSENRVDDSESAIEIARHMRKFTESDEFLTDEVDRVNNALAGALNGVILAICEVEGWIINKKGEVLQEVREMAAQVGIK